MLRRGPGDSDNRNMILAVVLSVIVVIGFQWLFPQPTPTERTARREAERQVERSAALVAPERTLARTQGERVAIDTPRLDGSLLLTGARIDDLNLRNYRLTTDRDSPEVRLLAPRDTIGGSDAFFGWEANQSGAPVAIADSSSAWSANEGARLTPETPLTLTLNADGVEITRTISVDRDYMFTSRDVVRNASDRPLEVRPYGVVRRQNRPLDFVNNGIIHQGMSGVFGPERHLHEVRYDKAEDHAKDKDRGRAGADERILELSGRGGWLGLSDHYWLTALAPDQSEEISGWYDSRNERGFTDFRTAYRGQWRALQPGEEIAYTQRLFAGAKRVDTLRMYQSALNLPDFDKAIDWGNFFILTRPFFNWLLHPLSKWAGSFVLGILLTTIVVRIALFWLVYRSNVMMAKMRKLQPKMQEIQERYKADKQRVQQEMIRLYQTEKINPVSGCLPILVQIPIFYALYKVLSVTIEMRHAPFFGWIKDLSARDPSNIFNLFGLLPFEPQTLPLVGPFLWLGVWPILYGITMWALQALSPPPTDPTQKMVFRFLPILFTFMFAGFAVGLVIYWTWSNILSIAQQYVIMRRMGVETELDKLIAKRMRRAAPTAAE